MSKRYLVWPDKLFVGSNERQASKPTKERAIARLQSEIIANFCLHVQLQLQYVQSLIGLLCFHLLLVDLTLLLLNPPPQSIIAKWTKSIGRIVCVSLYIASSFVAFYASLRHRLSLYRWHVLLLCASALLMSLHLIVFGASHMIEGNLVGQWIFDRVLLRRYLYGQPRLTFDQYRLPQLYQHIDSVQSGYQCCGFDGAADWLELSSESFGLTWNEIQAATDQLLELYERSFDEPYNELAGDSINKTTVVTLRKARARSFGLLSSPSNFISSVFHSNEPSFGSNWTLIPLPKSCCAEQFKANCSIQNSFPGCKSRLNLYNPMLICLVMSWLCLAYVVSALVLPAAVYVLRRYELLLAADRKGHGKSLTSKQTVN
jgi:hypothetical protein